jgi:hypothetical protein
VLLNNRFDNLESIKVRILEVALAIKGTRGAAVTVSSFSGHVVCLIFAREKTASNRVVDDNIETVAAAGRDQFSLDVASCLLGKWLAKEQEDHGYHINKRLSK